MRVLTFTPAAKPIATPITKFGGQPNWLGEPQWPLSRSTSHPMRFICQVRLPVEMQRGGQEMAYVFMTDEEDVDGTWEPEGGENAVILQPGPFVPIVATTPSSTGPTLQVRREKVSGFFVKKRTVIFESTELSVGEKDIEVPEGDVNISSRIGGEPGWLQNEETPSGGDWRFLMQIDSTPEDYCVNFGDAGIAYVFVQADGRKASFLWQCC